MDRTGFYTSDDGAEIWYGSAGSGRPVVLCDGLACDGFIWPYLVDELVEDFQLVRWHYRGHGQSTVAPNRGGLDLATFTDDLSGVLDQLGLDEAVLAGHSLGVQFALEFYRRHTSAVRGLALICGNYKRPLETFHGTDLGHRILPYIRTVVDTVPETAQSVWENVIDSPVSRAVALLAEVNPRLMEAKDVEPYLEHVARMDLEVFADLLEEAALHSAEDILESVDVPTLVIAGENDTFTPLFRSREMAERIPDGRLVVIPGGTHVAPLEAPDRVNRQVRELMMRVAWSDDED